MSKAQKVIDQICFGEDHEALKAFRAVQNRGKRELANFNAAGEAVKQSASALQSALLEFYDDNSPAMLRKFTKVHSDHQALEAAYNYAAQGSGAVRDNFCNCPNTIEALDKALKIARDRLGKRIAALNETHAKQLEAEGLDITESPSLAPLKDFHRRLAEGISEISDARRDGQRIGSLWTKFSPLIHLS